MYRQSFLIKRSLKDLPREPELAASAGVLNNGIAEGGYGSGTAGIKYTM